MAGFNKGRLALEHPRAVLLASERTRGPAATRAIVAWVCRQSHPAESL